MTDNEMRIAIAEACGIAEKQILRWIDYEEAERQFQSAEINEDEYYRRNLRVEPTPTLPDYPNDLNAMHEAEKTLGITTRRFYAEAIANRLRDQSYPESFYELAFAVSHATARQRAEAFLRTIGKWKV